MLGWKNADSMRMWGMIERQNGTEKEVVIVLTTFPNQEISRQIGTQWVESQLAACVNLVPGAESIYRWEGKTEVSGEVLAVVKTTRGRLPALEASLRSLHPYALPEFLVLSPTDGSPDYFGWVCGETTLDKPAS